MATCTKTLADLFADCGTDEALMLYAIHAAWPIMRRVEQQIPPDPTTHTLLTAQVTEAITSATGAEAARIILASSGRSPFEPDPVTDYGHDLEFGKSLTCRLMEFWRPRFTRRACELPSGPSWPELKDSLWTRLLEAVGENIAGGQGRQMASAPRSSASDAYLALLLCHFGAAALGDGAGVDKIKPLLDIAPIVLPIGETSQPGAWKCVVIGTPLVIKSL